MSVKFEIHPCPFESRPCDNWGCTNAFGVKKYFIGRPDASIPKPIFCEHCIRHMLANIPTELIEGGADLESRLREEIEQEYEIRLEQTRIELGFGVVDRQSLTEALQAGDIKIDENGNVTASGTVTGGDPTDNQEQPNADAPTNERPDTNTSTNGADVKQTPQIFRCLDCGNEYDSAAKLGSHRRVHKEG